MSDTRFKPGVSGNPAGRPKGSRNALAESFLSDLAADWQDNGAEAIAAARADDPVAYVRVVAGLLPKELKVSSGLADLSDDELATLIGLLRAAASGGVEGDAGGTGAAEG